MKKNNIVLLLGLFMLSLLYTGCADVLDKKEISAVSEKDVWNDPSFAEAYLNKLYRDNIPVWVNNISNGSEEADGTNNRLYGQLTSDGVDNWPYDFIRNINILLENIGTGSIDVQTQNKLKAQALVLRAWRYFTLVRDYGGVPMVMNVQKLTDDLYVARSKTSECIQLIIKDLDEALEGDALPWQWTGNDAGRISRAAALALKGRILLYYASPQFTPTSNEQRWTNAYNANLKAKTDLSANGYDLYESYENLWYNEMNKEAVFVSRYLYPGRINSFGNSCRPVIAGQNGAGLYNHATWEMVKSYPMITGVPINESSDYDPVYYWRNRDPRFEATIAYNGCYWPLTEKNDGPYLWTYEGYEKQYATETSFYCRKAVDPTYTKLDAERGGTDWIEIRYAEVLMNYAEAAAELNKLDEAYTVLKQIRERAGILAGNNGMYGLKTGMDKDAMIQAIMNERKIEFAYEGKRFWDLRRRRMFASELNGTKRHGLKPMFKPGVTGDVIQAVAKTNPESILENYADYFNDNIIEVDKIYTIDFKDNYYFYALPNKHLEANSKLEQTQGWNNGTFNPLE
ncbi:MAG: RagB/SusD family nutrient uptake outer membrane protein [Candidatus Symbiothrix sp.]|jgi:hypothetical protein|nr:RagB/SusD family nutrient uptake outer membrane protein [Candidatus Symbiothrix sp.]